MCLLIYFLLFHSDQSYPSTLVPGQINLGYPHTAINYNYTTTAQSGLNNRAVDMVRDDCFSVYFVT